MNAIDVAVGPRKRRWLWCVIWLCLIAIAPATVCAQRRSGSADLRGSVSKTVTVSLSSHDSPTGVDLHAVENDGALSLVLSGSEFKRDLHVTILIRSNTAYNIQTSVQSQTAVLAQLQVISVEAGGKLVAGDAVTGIAVTRQFDQRHGRTVAGEENVSPIDASAPFTIVSGPRISLGGGLETPQNALKVSLLLSVQARAAEGSWTIGLKLQGSGTDTP